MCIMVRQQQLSTPCLIMVYVISSLSFVFRVCLATSLPSSLTSASSCVSSNQLTSTSSTMHTLLPTHSTHTQPQQRTMRRYTINPAFTVFITGMATFLFALWMVSNSLLKSVNSSLIPSQVETHWWLLRHLQIPIRCQDA